MTEYKFEQVTLNPAVRIGVTGHRVIADESACQQSIAEALDYLQASLHSVAKPGDKQMTLVSGLAEGADRILARDALARGWCLQGLLPFSVQEYLKDFDGEGSVAEFNCLMAQLSGCTLLNIDRERAQTSGYEAVGKLLVQNIDLLIAVWDGKAARGAGGTAEVVSRALQEGVPVLWCHTEQDYQLYWLEDDSTESNQWQQGISSLAALIDSDANANPSVQGSVETSCFLDASLPKWRGGVFFPVFQRLFAARKLRKADFVQQSPQALSEADWDNFQRETAIDMPDQNSSQAIHRHYMKADLLASLMAQKYRSASMLNYFLAALAVLMALLGLLVPDAKLYWIVIEIFLIGGMLLNTFLGKRSRLHQRWLDYRQLAEHLRVARYFCLMGACSLRQQRWLAKLSPDIGINWVDRYLSCVIRETTMPNGALSPECLLEFRQGLQHQLEGQVRYHRYTATQALKTEHRLHLFGELCLYGTLLACFIFLVVYLFTDWGKQIALWVTFVTALLPAFGTSSFGMRAHGDFEGIAKRSLLTVERLEEIIAKLQEPEDDLDNLLATAELIRQVKSSELREWRVTFERKSIAVPG